MLRGMLDGALLPGWMHDSLRRERIIKWRRDKVEITDAMQETAVYDQMSQREVVRLQQARAMGMATQAAPNTALIDTAEATISRLRGRLDAGKTPPSAEVQAAANDLETALNANSPRLLAGAGNQQYIGRLAAAHTTFLRVLADSQTEARYRFENLVARHRTLLTILNPQPTRMADARRLIEDYSSVVYQADFDYLWPRLQLVMPEPGAQTAQGGLIERLTFVRAQVDFAVLSLALALTVPVVWLPLLAFTAESPWLFLGVALVTPVVGLFFYQLSVESQIALSEAVKSAIDRYRIDLLTKVLRQPMPATLSAERELWSQLRRAEETGEMFELIYRHPVTS